MQLHELARISAGMKTLAELERSHPQFGADLLDFLDNVGSACRDAYTNFSKVLSGLIALPNPPDRASYDRVTSELTATYDHQWFKVVADVCARLRAAEAAFTPALNPVIAELKKEYSDNVPSSGPTPPALEKKLADADTLSDMISTLRKYEGGLEQEIESDVNVLQALLADGLSKGDISAAKRHAAELQRTIRGLLREIDQAVLAAVATSNRGARRILVGNDAVARQILSEDPHKLLKLNAAILFMILILGAAIMQYISVVHFVALTCFALAAIVVMNAITLLNSGKIDQATFLEVLRLSLLHTFVPLMGQMLPGRRTQPVQRNAKPPSARPSKPR